MSATLTGMDVFIEALHKQVPPHRPRIDVQGRGRDALR